MGGASSTYEGEKKGIQGLVGKSDRLIPLGRPRLGWEDNIKLDLQQVKCGVWTGLLWLSIRDSWWSLVNSVLNLQVP